MAAGAARAPFHVSPPVERRRSPLRTDASGAGLPPSALLLPHDWHGATFSPVRGCHSLPVSRLSHLAELACWPA